jgi:hypothetical protein
MAKDRLSGTLAVILHADVAGSTALVQQDEQLELLSEETEAQKILLDRGLLPRPGYLALLRNKARIEGDMAENAAGIARLRQSIGETKLRIVNEDAVRLDQIVSEMAENPSQRTRQARLHFSSARDSDESDQCGAKQPERGGHGNSRRHADDGIGLLQNLILKQTTSHMR